MHACPRCGRLTNGSMSEGGLRWAICDDCMDDDRIVIRLKTGVADDCPRCGGRGVIRNDGYVWVVCPICKGNRH